MALSEQYKQGDWEHIKNPNEQNDFICGERYCRVVKGPWTQRITDRYGMVFCLGGSGVVSYGKKSLTAGAGDLIFLKPNFSHTFSPSADWNFLWFHFSVRPHIAYALKWPEQIPGVACINFDDDEFSTVQTILQEAHRLEFSRPRNWYDSALLLVESIVVRGFSRSISDSSGISNCVQIAQRLLTETNESIDTVARRSGVSRAGLYAKFRAEVGVSPRQYREDARLRRAAQLLEVPELSVSEVAQQVGILDPYYFSTRFHHFFGVCPREFRKQFSGA